MNNFHDCFQFLFPPLDVDRGEILKMIKSNVEENKEHINGEVIVNELDFFTKEWKESLKQILPEVTTIVAADRKYQKLELDSKYRLNQDRSQWSNE